MSTYSPIGFKSDYSLLKSLLRVKDIIEYAKKNNLKYVGLLDDNSYSIMDFFDKAEKENIKPIIGMIVDLEDIKIYLYVKDYQGYKNLIQINELKYKKELSFDTLTRYLDGLVCVLPIINKNKYQFFASHMETFLAYQNNEEKLSALKITEKIIFLNEIQCFRKEELPLLNIIYKIGGQEYIKGNNYILAPEEDDIERLDSFVNNLNLSFNYDNKYIPVLSKDKVSSFSLLKTLAIKGLNKRLNSVITDNYKNRLIFELNTIKSMGYVDYFLIVFDYVKFAKKNNIMVGPGRGSAAGSLVSYALGITEIDPLKYNLLFERFLNPERITMPDIDIDFEDEKREQVIDYVRKKYGQDKVSLIVAYGTLGSKQVIRDVGKILLVENTYIDKLCSLIDAKKTLIENTKNKDIVTFIKENKLSNLYKICIKLEGIKRHTTIHAAGVVISSVPLTDVVPIYHTPDGILTGYTMEYLEKLGLLKMDFLGLRNLTTIHKVLDLIQNKEQNFKLKSIPLNDKKTFELFKKANTDNIFQFESIGMKNFLKKLEPEKFLDLVAANALFRPGPMDNIDEFCQRRKGQKKVEYLHPDLEPILKETYGIIVYQEQIMQILSKMGGYTFAEADLIRRAMSKKKMDVMEKEKVKFIEKSIKNGYQENIATNVYNMIVKFANYGFNKSHSVAYALVGYYMAYLKVNYPDLFNVNTLNMNASSDAKIKDVIMDSKNKGLKIIKPNINKSAERYIIENNQIILPLTAIKGVSSLASKIIIENRPYSDFFEFIKKAYTQNISKTMIENLIKSGALEDFNLSKNTLLENIDSAITYLELCKKLDEDMIMKPEIEISSSPDTEYSDIDLYGFYVNGHPASKNNDKDIIKLNKIKNYLNKNINIYVLIESIKEITTKKGEQMAFLIVSDDTSSVDAVIFPKNKDIISKIENNSLYKFSVSISLRNNEPQIIINQIMDV